MRSMDETLSAPGQESEREATLAAETAEAHALAQRAAAPEIGQQDWLAAEEVAVQPVPGEEMSTPQRAHRHAAGSRWNVPARVGRCVRRLVGKRR